LPRRFPCHSRTARAVLGIGTRQAAKPSFKSLQSEIDRMEEQYADDGDYDEATADALDTASRSFSEPTAEEEALLKKMKTWATRAVGKRESKLLNW